MLFYSFLFVALFLKWPACLPARLPACLPPACLLVRIFFFAETDMRARSSRANFLFFFILFYSLFYSLSGLPVCMLVCLLACRLPACLFVFSSLLRRTCMLAAPAPTSDYALVFFYSLLLFP
jgi:hypothetical protein